MSGTLAMFQAIKKVGGLLLEGDSTRKVQEPLVLVLRRSSEDSLGFSPRELGFQTAGEGEGQVLKARLRFGLLQEHGF